MTVKSRGYQLDLDPLQKRMTVKKTDQDPGLAKNNGKKGPADQLQQQKTTAKYGFAPLVVFAPKVRFLHPKSNK